MTEVKMLSIQEVAERYGVSRQTVHAWIGEGLQTVPGPKRDSRTGRFLPTYIAEEDVESYVAWRKARNRWGNGKRGDARKNRRDPYWPQPVTDETELEAMVERIRLLCGGKS